MAENDTHLAIENAVEQLEQAPAVVKEMHKLKSLRTRLRAMGLKLEELDGPEFDQDVDEWLNQVREVAYKTQEVVGSIVGETNHQNQKSKLGRLLSGKKVTKHHVKKIGGIEEEIEGIEKCFKDSNKESHHSHRSISFKIDEVVGFNDAQETLVRKLIGDAKSKCEVLLIHGKAGSGKTTLAKMVSNHGRIKEHFGNTEWMSFPQQLPLEDFLFRNLSNQTDCVSKNELKARFCESFKGKRYLVAIDCVHNCDKLDELMSLFPDESNGSRILLASRVSQTDLPVSFSYQVKPLDENQSWELLSRKVGEVKIHPHLEKLGKRMVEKCKGSPGEIVAMAANLNCSENTEQMWSKILEAFEYDDLSKYKDLPNKDLKLCLLYFGLFPEGARISAKQMIQMWIAEGLLKQKSSKEAEEIGEDYLKKLTDQSFIKIHTKKADGSAKTCHAEKFLHFCTSQGATEKFFEVHMNSDSKHEKDGDS